MKYLIQEANDVADQFFDLTKSIRNSSSLGDKSNELVLIGILTAQGSANGLSTHIQRALNYGAQKKEIISAIILALPVVGITKVNKALKIAIKLFNTQLSAIS